MNRALFLLLLPSLLAFAEDAPCTPAAPSASVEVSIKKGAKVKDLASWYRRVTCREVEAPLSAADVPLTISIEGKMSAGRIIDVMRVAAASAGYDVRDEFRKLRLEKSAEPCDSVKTAAILERVAKAPACSIDLDSIGCANGRVTLEELGPKLKVSTLTDDSLLHAIGLREGDELAEEKSAILAMSTGPNFELKVVRSAKPVTLRCTISGERNTRLHPMTLLHDALGPPPDSSGCAIDPSALTVKGDTVEVLAAKAPNLDATCFMRSTRIVPAYRDGKVQGFKLFSIRPNSLLASLGFQNGDTVKTINGRELDSPDKALELYAQMKSEKKFTVVLDRRGEAKTLTIVVK